MRCSYQFVACRLFALTLSAAICFAKADEARSKSQGSPVQEADVPPALVRSVRVIPGETGAAIEIMATRPITPEITTLADPLRLVVDLPKSLVTSRMRVSYRDLQVRAVRIDQFHKNPATVRLVIDLAKETSASWDAAGNRLMIRLHPDKPPSALAPAGAAASESSGSMAAGGLLLAGSRAVTGSSVTAGSDTAELHMPGGGEVRVCPGTTVSVTASQNGRDVMLGMSTGALETHYRLEASADSVLTPDFRILFAGPGEFDYAVSADSRGNTCVRALPGNSASVVVSELMGNGVYQVKPSEEVVFHSGQLTKVDSRIPADCGCSAASIPVIRAATGNDAKDPLPASAAAMPTAGIRAGAETASLPEVSPKDVHIQVDAPMVFRAPARNLPAAAPSLKAASLPLLRPPGTHGLLVSPLPPADDMAAVTGVRHGFLGKIRGFFANMFR